MLEYVRISEYTKTEFTEYLGGGDSECAKRGYSTNRMAACLTKSTLNGKGDE